MCRTGKVRDFASSGAFMVRAFRQSVKGVPNGVAAGAVNARPRSPFRLLRGTRALRACAPSGDSKPSSLGLADLHLARLGLLALVQGDGQDAVLEPGVDALLIDRG